MHAADPPDPWAVRQEIARQLGEAYPAWRVWISEHTWWATRRTPLPPGALRHQLYATVTADTPQQLRAEIDEQIERQHRYAHPPRRHLSP